MSSTAPPLQLLVVGLCGEAIFVHWDPQDTVELIKNRAFANASQAVLADGSRYSLILGVSCEQLCLVFGEAGDAAKLEDASLLQDCVGAHWRSEPLGDRLLFHPSQFSQRTHGCCSAALCVQAVEACKRHQRHGRVRRSRTRPPSGTAFRVIRVRAVLFISCLMLRQQTEGVRGRPEWCFLP